MKLKIKDGKATKQAGWDSLITDKAHKPKAMDKIYQAALKKIKPKPTKIAVRKLEATKPPPGWDYGVYAVYDITLANGDTVGCAIIVRTAEGESSGNVTLDSNYGGVVATKRGKDPVSVAKMLINDTVEHLSRVGAKASVEGAPDISRTLAKAQRALVDAQNQLKALAKHIDDGVFTRQKGELRQDFKVPGHVNEALKKLQEGASLVADAAR